MESRSFHPVFVLEPFDPPEVLHIVRNQDGTEAARMRCDHQVVGTDELPLLLELDPNIGIVLGSVARPVDDCQMAARASTAGMLCFFGSTDARIGVLS